MITKKRRYLNNKYNNHNFNSRFHYPLCKYTFDRDQNLEEQNLVRRIELIGSSTEKLDHNLSTKVDTNKNSKN